MGHNYDLFTIKTIYIIINLLCMLVTFMYGKKIAKAKSKKAAWQFGFFIIVAYSVCIGLRFGRDIDYNNLYYSYQDIGKDFIKSDYEIVFKIICWTLYQIGIPYSGFIWLCSIMMVTSFLHLCIHHYREYAPLAGLIFIWESHDVELLIRFYLAFSFLLFALSYFKSKKYKASIILSIMACMTHIGMIPLVGVMVAMSFLKGLFAPPVIIMLLFLGSTFLARVEMLQTIAPYLNILAFNDKSANYVDSYEDIVSGNFSAAGSLEKEFSLISFLVILAKWSLPVFLAPRLIKEGKLSALEANLFMIGIIISPIFSQVHILNRYAETFTFYSVFVSSSAVYYVVRNRKNFNPFILYYSYMVAFFTIWPAVSKVISQEYWWHMLYIWDAGDWNTIPLDYFFSETI